MPRSTLAATLLRPLATPASFTAAATGARAHEWGLYEVYVATSTGAGASLLGAAAEPAAASAGSPAFTYSLPGVGCCPVEPVQCLLLGPAVHSVRSAAAAAAAATGRAAGHTAAA